MKPIPPIKSLFTLFTLLALLVSFFYPPQSARAAILSKAPNNLSLAGYWSFDEGVGAQAGDLSGNGNTGTVTGATWTNGKRGKALDFPGSGDPSVSVSSSASLNFGTGSFSVSMWGNFQDFTYPKAWFMIKKSSICYSGAGDAGWDIGHSYYADGIYICYTDGTNLIQNGAVAFDTGYKPADWLNRWVNLTVVFDKSANRVKFYVNGVKQTNEYDISTVTGSVSGSDNLSIGTMYGWQTDGILDDVRIYSRALSATDITSLYRSGQITRKTVSNQGLVGYWPFNEGVGSIAGDSSGNGNTGTITGATWTNGKRGKALSFNGSSTYVTSPTISIADTITASAWVYSTNFNQNGFVVGKNNVNEQWELFFEGYLRWRGGATVNNDAFCDPPANNQWHHIAATQTGTSAVLYLDGVQCDTGTMPAIANGSGTIDIGRFNGGYYFNGLIDDVRLYNRVLSATEILNLYKQTETKINSSQNTRLTDGLVGLWSFNGADISGTTAYDRSGRGNNGTISGSVTTIGKVGQAIDFNGSSNYIVIPPNDTDFTTGATGTLSFSFWIKSASYSGVVLSRRHACNNPGHFSIYTSGSAVSLVFYSDLEVGQFSYTSGNILTTNEWNHVVITKQWGTSGATKLYLNGVSQTFTPSGNDAARGTTYTGLYEYIGATTHDGQCNNNDGAGPFNNFYNGQLDEVRIYNRVLSADEAKQLYNMGK